MVTVSTISMPLEATPREAIIAPGSLPSIHAVYEDPFKPNRWSTQSPTRVSPPAENVESAQHAVVARYKLSDNPSKSLDLHSIVVQSSLLKLSLARALSEYPGITTELERLEFHAPFECFVHRWDQLCAEQDVLMRQCQSGSLEDLNMHDNAVTHLNLLFSTLEGELHSVVREKGDLVTHGVMKFQQIWTLFEPGCLIDHKFDGHDRVFKLKMATFTTNNSNNVYQLECQYVDFDGTKFGYNKEILSITEFRGTKKITKLEAYPLEFHED